MPTSVSAGLTVRLFHCVWEIRAGAPIITSRVAAGKRHTSDYEDVSLLEMLGYKQELFRGLYGFMNFAVCITCVNSVACVVRRAPCHPYHRHGSCRPLTGTVAPGSYSDVRLATRSQIVLYGSGLTAGGPVVMVWGWLVVMVFTMFAGLSMAEISSSCTWEPRSTFSCYGLPL